MRGVVARAGALLAVLALGACATLSEQECRATDWEAMGRADGASGAQVGQFERHREACARHGVEAQEAAWRAGYAKGLESFCTPRGGYLAGRDGQGHKQACAGRPAEEPFLRAFRDGREVNALRREVAELRQALRDYEMAVLSGDYNEYETTQARLRIGELDGELRSREWELERLDGEYAAAHGAPRLKGSELRRAVP